MVSAAEVDLGTAAERASLGTDQHVLEVQLDLGLDTHGVTVVYASRSEVSPTIAPLSPVSCTTRSDGTDTP